MRSVEISAIYDCERRPGGRRGARVGAENGLGSTKAVLVLVRAQSTALAAFKRPLCESVRTGDEKQVNRYLLVGGSLGVLWAKTPGCQVLALRHCFTACRPRRPGLSFCRPCGWLRPSADAPTLVSVEQLALLAADDTRTTDHDTRHTKISHNTGVNATRPQSITDYARLCVN